MLAGDIHLFLESKDKVLVLSVAPDAFFDALKSIDVEVDHDNMDTNGWECDYWVKGKYKKQKLDLSGSAWYGNARIEKVK